MKLTLADIERTERRWADTQIEDHQPSPASWRAADFVIALIFVVVVGMVFV